MGDHQYAVLPNEAEAYIEALRTTDIRDVGSPRWVRQHHLIYKLSVQASLSVKQKEDEFLKDLFVSIGKAPVLVHELLLTELWKEKIFPEILKIDFCPSSTIPLYTVLYHETTVASLLGALLFHEDVIESVNEVLIDLIDYGYRKLVPLLHPDRENADDVITENEELKELLEKEKSLSFYLGITGISFLSHISRHLNVIPLCALHRLLNVHDIPMAFVSLLHETPWKRTSPRGDLEKYCGGAWIKADGSESHKVQDMEGQIWVALIQLLLNTRCIQKYEITSFRKSQLLKLRPRITETTIDQIPVLAELLRFLEQLTLFEPPPSKPDPVIEQVPEIREAMLNKHCNMWNSIAQKQVEKYFALTKSQLEDFYKRLSDTYDMESLEATLPVLSVCANCCKKGSKRCSRCKNEWYCGRKCQVQHWNKHKKVCSLLADHNQI